MDAERLVLVQGMADTRVTLERWSANPWPVLRRWLALSAATSCALLFAVLIVAKLSTPDPTPLRLPGIDYDPTAGTAWALFARNLLVLALHAMACVAGFMAGASMPQLAATRTGLSKTVHENAGRFAILFVIGATLFSLSTQAYVLGSFTSTLSAQHHVAPATLLVALLPHALPELTALFLPLAAWTLASRRGEWNTLLAATFVTTAIALPVVLASAFVEVYVSPHLIEALIG
jgi:Stage II sporulation protein M